MGVIRRSQLFRNSDEELRRLEREAATGDPWAEARLRRSRSRSDVRQIAFDAGFRAMLSGQGLYESLSDASQGTALEWSAGHEAAQPFEDEIARAEERSAYALRRDSSVTFMSLEEALAAACRQTSTPTPSVADLRDLARRATQTVGAVTASSADSATSGVATQAEARVTLGLVKVTVTRMFFWEGEPREVYDRGVVWLDPTTLEPVAPPVVPTLEGPYPVSPHVVWPEPPSVPPRAELAGNNVLTHQFLAAARTGLAAPDLAASLLPELRELFPATSDSIMNAIIRAQFRVRERRLDPTATEREIMVFIAGDTLPMNFRFWHGGGDRRAEPATSVAVHVLRPTSALVFVNRRGRVEERVWIETPLWLTRRDVRRIG